MQLFGLSVHILIGLIIGIVHPLGPHPDALLSCAIRRFHDIPASKGTLGFGAIFYVLTEDGSTCRIQGLKFAAQVTRMQLTVQKAASLVRR